MISVNQYQNIEIIRSCRPQPVLNKHYLNYKVDQTSNISGLIHVNIVGRGPTKPKFVPVCMVVNARSLAKANNAVPALFAELKHNTVDICIA